MTRPCTGRTNCASPAPQRISFATGSGSATAGADYTPWELPGQFDEDSGHRAGQALLALEVRPDAVFAANDMMAIGCLYALGRGGVRTPADVAVVGFDDIPLARYVHPSLTTMRVDIAELGARALKALLEIEASGHTDTATQSVLLEPALVIRDSSGSAASLTSSGEPSSR